MKLSETSQRRLEQYVAAFPQSALLTGDEGIGFEGAIEWLAHTLQLTPYRVWPEKDGEVDHLAGSITVERIRTLYDITKSRSKMQRLIVIDDADRMSLPAQNAFLKLLEEPTPMVHFLLLSHVPSTLLPTIRSRVVTMRLTPIDKNNSQQLLDELGVTDATKRQQLLFIADGLPALLTMLTVDEHRFEQRAQIVRDARTLIQGTTYAKLQAISRYKERRDALTLLKDASKLLSYNVTPVALKRLATYLDTHEHIEANGNIKLWLAQAVL